MTEEAPTFFPDFTPRKPNSVWSQRNIDLVERLTAEDRLKPEGLAAFAHKDVHPNSGYRVPDLAVELTAGMIGRFKATPGAWDFYQGQPSGYRRHTANWVMGAKREETRRRRLSTLIDHFRERPFPDDMLVPADWMLIASRSIRRPGGRIPRGRGSATGAAGLNPRASPPARTREVGRRRSPA